MNRKLVLAALVTFALSIFAEAQTTRQELWRGLWISLPEGTEVRTEIPGPIPEISKTASFERQGEWLAYIELWRQTRGLVYGAEIERRLRRRDGQRNVTARESGNSYWVSATYQGQWEFTRKIRLSPTRMIKAGFSVPVGERHTEATRLKRSIIMSISVRKK